MEVKTLCAQAKRRGACTLLKGNETLPELLALFVTPQGIEFYQKTGFPTIETLRQFKGRQAQVAGVYIDEGEIEIHNAKVAVLIGATHAKLTYNDAADVGHQVIAMCGAMGEVSASNWAVVFVNEIGGAIVANTTDNAIIL